MIRLLAILAILAIPALSTAAPQDEARTVIQAWIDAQKNIRSLAITFQQERLLKGLTKPVVATGGIWLDKRGSMRWQMGEPAKTIAVYRDKEVTILHPAKKRAEKRVLGADASNQGSMEQTFLETGAPDSLADFEKIFRILGVTRENSTNRVAVELLDARARTALTAFEFHLDAETRMMTGFRVAFRDGSSITTRFLQVRQNPVLDPGIFNPPLDGYTIEPLKN